MNRPSFDASRVLSITALTAILCLLSTPLAGQIAAGTLFQSLDNLQPPGVTQVTLPGDPAVTKSEIHAWSAGNGTGGGRVQTNFLALATMLGDQNGDGLPVDLDDVDALEVGPYTAGTSPNVFDFRFSLANPVLNGFGIPIITPGDIIQITGVGTFTKLITENAFKSAIGTGQPLDVDAYCELPTGEVMVSFRGGGQGSNIINPLSGNPGLISYSGADIFIIRPPFGAVPALFAYRQAEIQNIVAFYYLGYNLTEIVGVEVQPFAPNGNNPWDPTSQFQGGTRPPILWTVEGDEEVFCGNPASNPLGSNTNFFALVSGGSGAGFDTNTGNNVVAADALAWGPDPLPGNSRVTLDAEDGLGNAFFFTPPVNLTLSVRSPAPQGTQFQIAVTTQLGFGQGLQLPGFGFESIVLNLTDPLLFLGLSPPVAQALTTAPAAADGSASTAPLPIPLGFPAMNLYFQAFQLPTATLSGPLTIRIN